MSKRRTTTTPVAVYRYGLRAPVENAELVYDQMRAAHRYRNVLVGIEQAKRLAVTEVQLRCGDLAAVESELSVLYASTNDDKSAAASVRAERKALRKTLAPRINTLKAERAVIKAAMRGKPEDVELLIVKNAGKYFLAHDQNDTAAMAGLRAERTGLDARMVLVQWVRSAYEGINERKTELEKAARAQCGVYWGTYLLIEKAIEDAAKKPNGLQFRRWDRHGRIGVQLQGGEDASALLCDEDTRLRIINRSCGRQPKYATNPDDRFRTLQIRIGSDGRAPIFATFPLFMDRPLPPNTRIKNAYVTMTEVSPSKTDWHVCFTIESAALAPGVIHRGLGVVAINIGWRASDDSLRVGTWVDDRGRTGEIRPPECAITHYEKASSLRAIRDRMFNAARDQFKALGGLVSERAANTPAWFTDALRWAHAWRSPERLVRLVERWREQRFDGGALALYETLEVWRRQERHLHDWEDNARIKANRQRDNHYREEALKLVRAYTTVVIGDENYSDLAVKQAADPVPQPSANRFHAAPSILRAEIRSCGSKHGAEVEVVEMANLTKTCHACSQLCVWDQRRQVNHTCEHCGRQWDQDQNAARNMLRVHASGPVSSQTTPPLAEPEDKADAEVSAAATGVYDVESLAAE